MRMCVCTDVYVCSGFGSPSHRQSFSAFYSDVIRSSDTRGIIGPSCSAGQAESIPFGDRMQLFEGHECRQSEPTPQRVGAVLAHPVLHAKGQRLQAGGTESGKRGEGGRGDDK